jgi:hypothetical protein
MLNSQSINYMPARLQAFRKYIEKYDCAYMVTPSNEFEETGYALIFYHDGSRMPYLMICLHTSSKWATIYVNKYADNWCKENANEIPVRKDCIISNDMKAFLEAINECALSTPKKKKKAKND